MAITTCNLPSPDKRQLVRDLLTRYESHIEQIDAITHALHDGVDFAEVYINGVKVVITNDEVIGVIDRRKTDIEQQLSKLGINLKSQDESPSASPVLDAAVRALNNSDDTSTLLVTESVTPPHLQQPGCIEQ